MLTSFAAENTALETILTGNGTAPPLWPADATPEFGQGDQNTECQIL